MCSWIFYHNIYAWIIFNCKQIAKEMDAGFFSRIKTDDNLESQTEPDLQALIKLSKQHPDLLAKLIKEMQEKLDAKADGQAGL